MPLLPFLSTVLASSFWIAGPEPPDAAKLQGAKNVGLAALEEGNLEEARKRFEMARRLAPDEPLGWANGAVAALRSKDLATARRLLVEALRLAPSDARLLALEGTRRELAGDAAGALEAYEKAAADPKDSRLALERREDRAAAAGRRDESYPAGRGQAPRLPSTPRPFLTPDRSRPPCQTPDLVSGLEKSGLDFKIVFVNPALES